MSDFIERAKFSCALGGAIATLSSIPRAVPIVHASGGCAAMLSNTYNMGGGYRGSGYCGGNMIPTSNIAENNLVFGGEDRLEEQIENTVRIIDADLYFVVTGCQVEIIGDDAVGVTRRFKNSNAPPVLAANTPGFLGNTYKGYDVVLSTIVSGLTAPAEKKAPKTVNILGIVPGQDVFYKGNLREIRRLLARLGLHTNTFFAEGESVEKIKRYGEASLTVVFSESYGIDTAKTFEREHDIPYITEDLPIGPTRTEAFLRDIAGRFDIPEALLEEVIAQEKELYYSYVENIVDIYSDLDLQRYAIVSADSGYAYPLTSFLAEDLGWIPYLTVINDLFDEEAQAAYARKFGSLTSETKPKVVFEPHASRLLSHIRSNWKDNNNDKYYDALSPAFLVGSSIDVGAAQKIGAAFLPVAFPVTNRVVMSKGYTGFNGSVSLIEDLFTALVSNR